MKLRLIAGCLVMLAGSAWADPASPRLFMETCCSTLLLGKATLAVNPLIYAGKFYVGDYHLKVLPYFFKNEKGTLALAAPDDTMRKLLGGIAVKFTGSATNKKSGKIKDITGVATPVTGDKGNVTFSLQTENGIMIFNTSYRLAE